MSLVIPYPLGPSVPIFCRPDPSQSSCRSCPPFSVKRMAATDKPTPALIAALIMAHSPAPALIAALIIAHSPAPALIAAHSPAPALIAERYS